MSHGRKSACRLGQSSHRADSHLFCSHRDGSNGLYGGPTVDRLLSFLSSRLLEDSCHLLYSCTNLYSCNGPDLLRRGQSGGHVCGSHHSVSDLCPYPGSSLCPDGHPRVRRTSTNDNRHLQIESQMSEGKNLTQIIDKTTRNRIFNCRFWKQECFGLNAQTLIDKAVRIRCMGGLYGGAKKPTKYLCLVFKMLQMNLSKQIAIVYLKERQYKYLNAMAMLFLRLTVKAPQIYEILEPFYVDCRKLRLRNGQGGYELTHIDQFVDDLLEQEICMGLALPYIPKRMALEIQGVMEPRRSLIEEMINEEPPAPLQPAIKQEAEEEERQEAA